MKIKTLEGTSPEDIDKQVNEFEATHAVRATQSHVTSIRVPETTSIQYLYTYVVFYER
jgi:hypothetical protein